jgi:hypothetical protein
MMRITLIQKRKQFVIANIVSCMIVLFVSLCFVSDCSADAAATEVIAPVSIVDNASDPVGLSIRFAPDAYEQLKYLHRVRLTDFPLDTHTVVNLDLEQFSITDSSTIIIEHTAEGERPVAHPPNTMFKGYVSGDPDSHVVLGISPYGNSGFIRLGDLQYVVSAHRDDDESGDEVEYAIYELGDIPADKQTRNFQCGTKDTDTPVLPEIPDSSSTSYDLWEASVAVDTDYEYWQRFGNTDAAVIYAVQLMSAVSSIYERDIGIRLYLPYLRVWSDPSCPYDKTDRSQALNEFAAYWQDNMENVDRTLAHLLSGKNYKDGLAECTGCICDNDDSYSISRGITQYGWFPQPIVDRHADNWDLNVVAHEMGHNFGSEHTHCYDPPIDNCGLGPDDGCDNGIFACQVGTIMSYCDRVECGGVVNKSLSFHPRVVEKILLTSVFSFCVSPITAEDPVYVDVSNTGSEDGTIDFPYNTVEEGVRFVIPGGTIIIAPGSYPERFVNNSTLVRPMTLSSSGGTVTIGP